MRESAFVVPSFGFRAEAERLGFRAWGFQVSGFRFQVSGFGFRDSGQVAGVDQIKPELYAQT